MTWTAFDFIFILVLTAGFVLGLLQGLVRLVFSWVFFFLSFLASALFYDAAASLFSPWIKSPLFRNIAGYVLVFGTVYAAGLVLIWLVTRWLKGVKLRWLDRGFGAVMGLVMASALGLLAVFFGSCIPPVQARWLDDSLSAPILLRADDWLVRTMPRAFEKAYRAVRSQSGVKAPPSGVPSKDKEKENSAKKKKS